MCEENYSKLHAGQRRFCHRDFLADMILVIQDSEEEFMKVEYRVYL